MYICVCGLCIPYYALFCVYWCLLHLIFAVLCSFHFAGSDIALAADYSRFVDQRGLYISISYSNNNDYNKY